MIVVIGSKALSYYVSGIKPNDLDLVCSYEEAVEFKKKFRATSFFPIDSGKSIFMKNAAGDICEVEIAWEGSRAAKFLEFLEHHPEHKHYRALDGWWVPSLDVLYLLKMSHRFKKNSPHFLKTMRDIQMMRKMGCMIHDDHTEYFKGREKDTYTNNLPKLNVSRAEFFDAEATGVKYEFLHDTVHEAVKHFSKPAYEFFKPDTSEVYCSKDMFFACDEIVRLYSGVEEAMVLAIERSLVPFPGGKTPKDAFEFALQKLATSISSGWYREFIWENYDKIMELYHDDYFELFKDGVEKGVVKRV